MRQEDGTRLVYALLDPEQLGELEEIRAHYGAPSRAQAIRLLIRAEARRLSTLALARRLFAQCAARTAQR